MQEINRFKLGLFICGGVLLLVATLIFLGSLDAFRDKAYLMTLVSESVQGLERGSDVKHQGVPIGKVTDITIETTSNLIRIDMEINLSKIKVRHGDKNVLWSKAIPEDEYYESLKQRILEKGLRCKIAGSGITGSMYIEFEYQKDPQDNFLLQPGQFDEDGYFYVPSVPSVMTGLRYSVMNILEKLEAVDYQGLAERIETTFAHADTLICDPRFGKILDNLEVATKGLNDTMIDLRTTITSDRVQKLLDNSNQTMTAIRQLSDMVNSEIKKAEVGETTERARNTMEAFRESNAQFVETMVRIDNAVDALTELIQMLDNDPSSLIHGKSNTRKSKFAPHKREQ